MDREELLRTIEAAHQEMADLLDRISDDRLCDQAMDGWTGKDVVSHLAWWQDHSARVIRDLREGRPPDDEADPASSIDEINERVYRDHLNDPPDQARTAFTHSFERLMTEVRTLTDVDLLDAGRWPSLEGEPLAETLL